MNLLFRLMWILMVSRFRTKVSAFGPCLTPFRCLPSDLDVLLHMTNGKYFSLMDLARVDLMARAALLAKLAAAAIYPVVVAETMKFQKSIGLFRKFEIESVVLGWDEQAFFVRQRFVNENQVFAEAVVRARFLKRAGGSVAPVEVLSLTEEDGPSFTLEPWIVEWSKIHSAKSSRSTNSRYNPQRMSL